MYLLVAFSVRIIANSLRCRDRDAWKALQDLGWDRPQEHAEVLPASGFLRKATKSEAIEKVLVPALAFDCKPFIKNLITINKIDKSWRSATKSDDGIPDPLHRLGLQVLREACHAAWERTAETKEVLPKTFLDQDIGSIYNRVISKHPKLVGLRLGMEGSKVRRRVSPDASPKAAEYKWFNDLLQDLLDNAKIDRDMKGREHCPILSLVTQVGCFPAVMTLMARWGVDPNARDGLGRTALHHAARCGHLEIAHHLCSIRNVAVGITDQDGKTPLHEACARGHMKIAEELLAVAESPVKSRDVCGHTPLHVAVLSGDPDTVRLLLRCKAVDVDLSTVSGETPLQTGC